MITAIALALTAALAVGATVILLANQDGRSLEIFDGDTSWDYLPAIDQPESEGLVEAQSTKESQ